MKYLNGEIDPFYLRITTIQVYGKKKNNKTNKTKKP